MNSIQEQPHEEIINELFDFLIDIDDDSDEVINYAEAVKELITQFLTDNNIVSSDQVKIQSSKYSVTLDDEWWENIKVTRDKEFIKLASYGFMDDGDVYLPEYASWRYDKAKKALYMSSQCGSYMNGDYFDARFTKIK